jgi:hypothetical protein
MEIIVECYGDNLLIKQLKYEVIEVHSGINEVGRLMQDYKGNRLSIGIIDADKKIFSKYLQSFKEIKKDSNIIFNKHADKNHYLIKICPAFEKFILQAANEVNVTRQKHKLPINDKAFYKLVKSREVKKNQNFINFVNAIVAKNPPSIAFLQKCINEAAKAK